jgi:hypothetical protein
MRFPVYFKRRLGAGTLALLGSDTKPTFATPPKKAGDNVLSHKLQRPMRRVAIGYWYEGAGVVPNLPVSIWAWDDTSEKFYQADSGILTNGEITYLTCLSLADPPTTTVNLDFPQHGIDLLIVVENAGGGDGTYHFVAGPDTANY